MAYPHRKKNPLELGLQCASASRTQIKALREHVHSLLCCIDRLCWRVLKSHRDKTHSFFSCFTLPKMLTGFAWVFFFSTSRNARLLPLSSRRVVFPEPKWLRRGKKAYSNLLALLEPKCRPVVVHHKRSFLLISPTVPVSVSRAGANQQNLITLRQLFPSLIYIILTGSVLRS